MLANVFSDDIGRLANVVRSEEYPSGHSSYTTNLRSQLLRPQPGRTQTSRDSKDTSAGKQTRDKQRAANAAAAAAKRQKVKKPEELGVDVARPSKIAFNRARSPYIKDQESPSPPPLVNGEEVDILKARYPYLNYSTTTAHQSSRHEELSAAALSSHHAVVAAAVASRDVIEHPETLDTDLGAESHEVIQRVTDIDGFEMYANDAHNKQHSDDVTASRATIAPNAMMVTRPSL